MALTLMTRRDPFADFDALVRRAFPVSGSATRWNSASSLTPPAEIVRDGEDALIKLDAPGLDFANDIDVELNGSTLVVSGERRDERTEADAESTRTLREIRYGTFRRSFTLPDHITADALSASYDAGVLTVRVSGAYAGTEPRKIAVTAGSTRVVSHADAETVEAGSAETASAQ